MHNKLTFYLVVVVVAVHCGRRRVGVPGDRRRGLLGLPLLLTGSSGELPSPVENDDDHHDDDYGHEKPGDDAAENGPQGPTTASGALLLSFPRGVQTPRAARRGFCARTALEVHTN